MEKKLGERFTSTRVSMPTIRPKMNGRSPAIPKSMRKNMICMDQGRALNLTENQIRAVRVRCGSTHTRNVPDSCEQYLGTCADSIAA